MKILKIIIAIIVSFLAGAIGSIFTAPAIRDWYPTLIKPSFNPPDWLFGPAWTILYILMGISLFIIWQNQNANKKMAYWAFFTQLILNALWSIIFFGAHQLGWALVEIVILWLTILWTIIVFWRLSKSAAYLLIPYLLWVTFATVLNFAVWRLN